MSTMEELRKTLEVKKKLLMTENGGYSATITVHLQDCYVCQLPSMVLNVENTAYLCSTCIANWMKKNRKKKDTATV
jgi:hypothetical protein